MKIFLTSFFALFTLFTPLANLAFAHADKAHVNVSDAWIRPTVEGQKGTGGFMKLTAREDLKLIGLRSSVAAVNEVHEMRLNPQTQVMQMRAIDSLDLPKGKTVELKPGGYHLMLIDLKQTLPKDSTVTLTLLFKDSKGAESKLDVQVPVSSMQPSGTANAHLGAKH